jgi:hypothetical protein
LTFPKPTLTEIAKKCRFELLINLTAEMVIIMKRAIAIMGLVLFVFTVTLVSFPIGAKGATAVTDKAKKKTTGHKKLKKVTGKVTVVDLATKSLTIDGITIIADDKMLADVKVGDKVRVWYITKGRHIATSIMHK